MTQLAASVDSSETLWTVDAIPDPEFGFYTVGSEIVEVIAGFPGGDPGYAVGQTFPSKIRVVRGTNDTTAASHLSGAALTAANAFSGGGGGGSGAVISATDPGAIGAGNLWVRLDPDETWPPVLYIRNAADDDWTDETGAGNLLGFTDYDDNDLIRAIFYVYGGQIQAFIYDASNAFRAEFSMGAGGANLQTYDALGAAEARLALGPTGVILQTDGGSVTLTAAGTLELAGVQGGPIAHVADGSTVDQLRDALIASGLMAAS